MPEATSVHFAPAGVFRLQPGAARKNVAIALGRQFRRAGLRRKANRLGLTVLAIRFARRRISFLDGSSNFLYQFPGLLDVVASRNKFSIPSLLIPVVVFVAPSAIKKSLLVFVHVLISCCCASIMGYPGSAGLIATDKASSGSQSIYDLVGKVI